MISKEFTVNCSEGFHLRPAQVLMETATSFESAVLVKTGGGEETDAKSILGLMSLGLEKGSVVTIETNGSDEEQAMKAVQQLFNSNFGE